MVVFLQDFHISTEELWSHRVLGHLPDQGPSPPIAQVGRVASSRKSLGGSKLLPFKNDRHHYVLGTFNAADMSWYPSPDLCIDRILSGTSPDNSFNLMAWFLL